MNITHQIQPSLNQLYLTQLSCLADWQIFWPQLAKLLSKDSELAALTFQHLTPDSRLVEQGSVFFALEGATGKGKDFLPQAKAKGARPRIPASGPSCFSTSTDTMGYSPMSYDRLLRTPRQYRRAPPVRGVGGADSCG